MRRASTGSLVALGLVATSCDDDEVKPSKSADCQGSECGQQIDAAAAGGSAEAPAPPAYVIATAVSNPDSASTYVKVLDALKHEQLDLSSAREFNGWSDMAVVGRWVFVSSGEEPLVERFELGEDGQLAAQGSINFGDYTQDANFYAQRVLSPTKAYLTTDTEYVVWNPTTLEIEHSVPLPKFDDERGIRASFASDRGMVVRGNRLFHAVNWLDAPNYRMGPTSRIVVVDTDNDSVLDILDVDCPDIDVGDQDEQGNVYFTTWVYAPGATIVNGDKPACIVRIPAGSEQVDTDWTVRVADLTGGHEASTIAYLGKGKALISVFYEDNQAFDPKKDEMFDWIFGNNWKLHTLDLETRELGDVDGIGWNGGGYYASRFDDRTHILVPGDGYTTTALYAIGADGSVTPEIETDGWSTRVFRLR